MAVSEDFQDWKNCTTLFDVSALFGIDTPDVIKLLTDEAENLKKYASALLFNYKKIITFMAATKTKPQTKNGLTNLVQMANECDEAGNSIENIALLLFQYESPEVNAIIEGLIEWYNDFLDDKRSYHSHYLNIVWKAVVNHNFINIGDVKSLIENGHRSEAIAEIAASIINFETSECPYGDMSKYFELRDSGKLDEFYNQNKMEYQSMSDICKFDKMSPDALKKFWPWD